MEAGISSRTSDDVVVTWSGDPYSPGIAVTSFTGVDQDDAPVTASSVVYSTATISTNITTPADGALVVTNVGAGDNRTYTHGAGQQEQWDQLPSSAAHSGTTRIVATAGPVTLSETASSSVNRQAHLVAAFAPAPVSASSQLVPLELTLSSSEGGTVTMRTKVFLRNLPPT
jgi:hypothetical protein